MLCRRLTSTTRRHCSGGGNRRRIALSADCRRYASTFSYAGVGNIVAIAAELAKSWNHPLAVHLDHHEKLADIKMKVAAGVRSVMIDGSHFPLPTILRW